MKKKYLFFCLLCTLLNANIGLAQNGAKKERITTEYITFLKEEGFDPIINAENKIEFSIDNSLYYIDVYDEDSPQYVIISAHGFKVDEINGFDRKISSKVIDSVTNNVRSIKLRLTETSVNVQAEMYFADTEAFKWAFYKLVSNLDDAKELFVDEYNKLSFTPKIEEQRIENTSIDKKQRVGWFTLSVGLELIAPSYSEYDYSNNFTYDQSNSAAFLTQFTHTSNISKRKLFLEYGLNLKIGEEVIVGLPVNLLYKIKVKENFDLMPYTGVSLEIPSDAGVKFQIGLAAKYNRLYFGLDLGTSLVDSNCGLLGTLFKVGYTF